MNFAIGDILQAWNQLTTSMSAGRALGANTIDYSFITPTIIGKSCKYCILTVTDTSVSQCLIVQHWEMFLMAK